MTDMSFLNQTYNLNCILIEYVVYLIGSTDSSCPQLYGLENLKDKGQIENMEQGEARPSRDSLEHILFVWVKLNYYKKSGSRMEWRTKLKLWICQTTPEVIQDRVPWLQLISLTISDTNSLFLHHCRVAGLRECGRVGKGRGQRHESFRADGHPVNLPGHGHMWI